MREYGPLGIRAVEPRFIWEREVKCASAVGDQVRAHALADRLEELLILEGPWPLPPAITGLAGTASILHCASARPVRRRRDPIARAFDCATGRMDPCWRCKGPLQDPPEVLLLRQGEALTACAECGGLIGPSGHSVESPKGAYARTLLVVDLGETAGVDAA